MFYDDVNLINQSCLFGNCNGGISVIAFRPSAPVDFITSTQQEIYPAEIPLCDRLGTYGNIQCASGIKYGIEFHTGDEIQIQNLVKFLNETIPNGYYVLVYSVLKHRLNTGDNSEPMSYYEDQVFEFFNNIGAPEMMFINPNSSFIVFGRKGVTSFPAQIVVPEAEEDKFSLDISFDSKVSSGSIVSPLIGPSNKWGSFVKDVESLDPATDNADKV